MNSRHTMLAMLIILLLSGSVTASDSLSLAAAGPQVQVVGPLAPGPPKRSSRGAGRMERRS